MKRTVLNRIDYLYSFLYLPPLKYAMRAITLKLRRMSMMSDTISFVPKVSIGINSGEMISGNIGSASLRRLDYTVIGDTVNTAQRLQSAANPGQIIISEPCYQKVKESFNCSKVG